MSQCYTYELMPLTPIHIGGGSEIEPYEYIIKGNTFYRIHLTSIYHQLTQKEQEQMKEYMLSDTIKLRGYVNDIYKESFGYINKMSVSPVISKLYHNKLRGTIRANEQNQLLIQEFIQSMGKEYIPGSTIKGALRGCVLHSLGEDRQDIRYTLNKNSKGRVLGVIPDTKGGDIEARYLEKSKVQEDPFKTVKVTDSIDELKVGIYESTIYTHKPRKGSFEKRMLMHMICAQGSLQEEQVVAVRGKISVQEAYFENSRSVGLPLTLEQIILDSHIKAKHMIEAELAFYKRVGYSETLEVYQQIEHVYHGINKQKQMLIRIGRGAGMNSTTFNLVNQDRSERTDPRSRMLIESIYPMGWAVVTLVE